MDRAFKGVWIPKEIWLDKTLGWSEKLLLVEIESLDNEDGCWASNEYFAGFFNLSKDRISKLISSLRKKGYITAELVYKPGTKKIEKRVL
ncbi:helix-turn-helix domain-containing protein, partial [Halalkalibacterium halodurans]